MKTREALNRFETRLENQGLDLGSSVPSAGLMALVAFYREVRAEDVELMADGDMLVFQWGTYDRGQGAQFELNLTRQLMYVADEEDDVFKLSLTYGYPPSDELGALGNREQWCFHPDELDDLVAIIEASEPYTRLKAEPAQAVELTFETTG